MEEPIFMQVAQPQGNLIDDSSTSFPCLLNLILGESPPFFFRIIVNLKQIVLKKVEH